MKLGKLQISGTSIALLAIQLALVSSIAGKYLYQRWTCPKAWVRSEVYDPELPMRGRYLSLRLAVDGCRSTLPSAFHAVFPRDVNGVAGGKTYTIRAGQPLEFQAQLEVVDGKLEAIREEGTEHAPRGVAVRAEAGAGCEAMRLATPVDFYLAEHAADPSRLQPGQELWVEVTVPPRGMPRPLQLAVKDGTAWRPLAVE